MNVRYLPTAIHRLRDLQKQTERQAARDKERYMGICGSKMTDDIIE